MDFLRTLIYRLDWWVNSPEFLALLTNNRFLLILLVIVLLHLKNATYRAMLMCAVVNIPGTFLHEMMHFLVGLFMNARPCNFTLLPRRGNDGNYVMGSVGFTNITFYNAVPASMAPLLLLPIGFYINRYVLPQIPPTFANYILYVFLQTVIIENAMPSGADFRVAKLHFLGVVLYAVLFAALFLML